MLGVVLCELASGCGGERFSSAGADRAGSAGAASGGRTDASGGNGSNLGGRPDGGSSGAPAVGGTLSQAGRANGGGGGAGRAGGAGGSAAGGLGKGAGAAGRANGGTGAVGGINALGGGVGLGGILNGGAGTGGSPIPTDRLRLWLDAQRGISEVSGAVSLWADQSGNGADAAQAVSSARPRRVSASNGLSMIEFDGDDDFFSLADGFADFSQGVSFFAIVEVSEERACAGILELSNGSEIDDIDFGRQGGAPHYEVQDAYFHGPDGMFELGQRFIVGTVHDLGQNAELRLNGEFQAVQSVPLPANVLRYDNFVGRSLYAGCPTLAGRIGEIVVYGRAVTDAERVRIEQYLANKWQ